ncbi:MAG: YceI family protein [Bacteroidota bacterium]
MKSVSLFGIFPILALLLTPLSTVDNGPSAKVDTAQSTVSWKAYKVTGSHEGTLTIKNGQLDMTDGQLTGGSFDIDMTSINCTDLSGGAKGKLEGHLHSPDFFNTAEFPMASFKITSVAPKGTPGDYKITGNLTIKNITKEIKFYTHIEEASQQTTAKADLTIDRTDFDVRYGSGSFFDNLGDKTIYDEFELTVNLVASN